MNSIIQNTIAQYFEEFAGKVSEKHDISREDLEALWRETLKGKLKISARRRQAGSGSNKKPSAYINFCKQHRNLIKEETPGLTFGEVAKALGERWKSLGADEKVKYADVEYVAITAAPVVAEEKKPKRARKNKE